MKNEFYKMYEDMRIREDELREDCARLEGELRWTSNQLKKYELLVKHIGDSLGVIFSYEPLNGWVAIRKENE